MTKLQEFWALIVRVTPGFGQADDTRVTMTIGNVRKLVAKAHKDGFVCGIQTAKDLENVGQTPDLDMSDLLRDLGLKS